VLGWLGGAWALFVLLGEADAETQGARAQGPFVLHALAAACVFAATLAPPLLPLLALAGAIRLGVPPFHGAQARVYELLPTGAVLLLSVGFGTTGLAAVQDGLTRLSERAGAATLAVGIACALAAAWAGLYALPQDDLRRRLAGFLSAQGALWCALLALLDPALARPAVGGWALVTFVAVFAVIVGYARLWAFTRTGDLRAYGGLGRIALLRSTFLLLALAALLAAPFLGARGKGVLALARLTITSPARRARGGAGRRARMSRARARHLPHDSRRAAGADSRARPRGARVGVSCSVRGDARLPVVARSRDRRARQRVAGVRGPGGHAVTLRQGLDRAASAITFVFGVVAIGVAVHALGRPGMPPLLDAAGSFSDDGWTRACRTAVLLVTGLAAIGLVRAPGLRRIAALLALMLSGAGIVVAAGALELPTLWGGVTLATTLAPLAIVLADTRRSAARHALTSLLLGSLASGILALSFLALAALSGSTHVLEIGFQVTRYQDSAPFALTAVRAAAVAVAMLAAWAPFHLALPELWGEGSSPLAGWLAILWPWAGWSVFVRLAGGLSPALEEWSFDGASAVSLFLVLGAILPGAAALGGRTARAVVRPARHRRAVRAAPLGARAGRRDGGRRGRAVGLCARVDRGRGGARGIARARRRRPARQVARPRRALPEDRARGRRGGVPVGRAFRERSRSTCAGRCSRRAATSPLVLVAVALGAFLRVLAVARLVAML
jgi:NADH:ubiquinone oxidoreductase subunit 2 (subunit N)